MDTPTSGPASRPTVDAARSTADLHRAAALGRDAQRATRWYVRYLVAFAVASFVLAGLYGVLDGIVAVAVSTPLWVVFLTVLSVWANRQRATLRGFARLHGAMIAAWAVLWGVVVTVGTRAFPETLAWWVVGGLVLTVPPLVVAARVRTRTHALA